MRSTHADVTHRFPAGYDQFTTNESMTNGSQDNEKLVTRTEIRFGKYALFPEHCPELSGARVSTIDKCA